MKRTTTAVVSLAPVATLLSLSGAALAQASADWSTAPIAIPAAPAGGLLAPADPATNPQPRSRREIQLPPPELRRPQAPLLPGGAQPPPAAPWGEAPGIRIAPGEGVRPLPPALRRAPPPAPSSSAPARPRPTPLPVAPVPERPPTLTTAPRSAPPRRLKPPVSESSSTPFPSLLEILPPGTIRPLPGETLPGSRPSPLQGMPPPPPPPQAVPPPPWVDPAARPAGPEVPWGWLLLGLGGGAISVFLLQGRSRPVRPEGPLATLGIRIVALPDPGRQSLQPAETAPTPSLPERRE